MVAMIALIVCRRFSAGSNTMLAPDSNTSPVTSSPDDMPACSMISLRTTVFGRGTPAGSA